MNAAPVVDWLLTEGVDLESIHALIAATGERMNAAGFGVVHMWQTRLVGHPLLQARGTHWTPEEGVVEENLPHGFTLRPEYASTPPFAVVERRSWSARAADGPTPYANVNARFAAGATDYFIFRTGAHEPSMDEMQREGRLPPLNVYAFTLKQDHGADEQALRRVMHALDPIVRMHDERHAGRSLLLAYLGRDAGERVLGGLVRRGEKVSIEAAIAFTDVRGFSALSESMAPEDVLDLLHDNFDVQVDAIRRHGGHVLKFMGDGLLAIWPEARCDDALAAAIDMGRSMEATNSQRLAMSKRPIDFGVGLHVGQVIYGNIGSVDRLDFTVIGSAVNRTARLESLCGRLGRRPLMSREFADRVSVPTRDLGLHELKGVGELRAFGLDG